MLEQLGHLLPNHLDPSPDPESPPRGLGTEDQERISQEGLIGSHLQGLESP